MGGRSQGQGDDRQGGVVSGSGDEHAAIETLEVVVPHLENEHLPARLGERVCRRPRHQTLVGQTLPLSGKSWEIWISHVCRSLTREALTLILRGYLLLVGGQGLHWGTSQRVRTYVGGITPGSIT